MRRRASIVLLAVALLAAAPLPAAAKGQNRVSTFTGTCELAGTVAFFPALTAASQEIQAVADASGPCTGTWRTGKRTWSLDGDVLAYHAETSGTQSCGSAEATGEGFLRYRGRRLAFTLTESRVATTAELRLEGEESGAARGSASAEGDPFAAVQGCLATGIEKAEISGTLETDPEISGHRPR